MISANGGLPAHRYTPQVTQRWPRGSEPASTLWEGFRVEEATWEPFSAFVLPEECLNSVLVDYLSQNNLGELLRLAETLASKTKARD